MAEKKSNKTTGTGLESNVAAALSYVLGAITGILFLVVERDDKFVRFHAMQSILFSVAVYVIYIILVFIPILGWILIPFWGLASFILWLVSIYKAYSKEEYMLPIIGEFAKEQVK